MTDKQIIIDGIDVSGCEYHSLNKNNCSLCSLSNNLICSYKPFCSYKQHKRKEQECEELKGDKIYLQDRVGKLERVILRKNDKLDQFEQTLAEIKKIVKEKAKVNDWLAIDVLKIINEVEE